MADRLSYLDGATYDVEPHPQCCSSVDITSDGFGRWCDQSLITHTHRRAPMNPYNIISTHLHLHCTCFNRVQFHQAHFRIEPEVFAHTGSQSVILYRKQFSVCWTCSVLWRSSGEDATPAHCFLSPQEAICPDAERVCWTRLRTHRRENSVKSKAPRSTSLKASWVIDEGFWVDGWMSGKSPCW